MKGLKHALKIAAIFLIIVGLGACSGRESPSGEWKTGKAFNPDVLKVADGGVNKMKGQVLYVPIYSSIPDSKNKKFDLSAFIVIHNTDLKSPIKITKVLYFNNDGALVKEFVTSEQSLAPLGAVNFYIPQADQSGTGANFLIEWLADGQVNEPLIESVMVNIEGSRAVSFLSKGKVIRELR